TATCRSSRPAGPPASEFLILHREAKALIEGAAKEDPNLKALQARARTLLKNKAKDTAAFDQALWIQPDQARLWLARGRRYAELKRWDKANADLARAVQLRASDPQIVSQLGRVYPELAPPDRVVPELARLIALVLE